MAWWPMPSHSIASCCLSRFHLLLMRQFRVNVRFCQDVVGFHCQNHISCLRLRTQGALHSGLMARFRLVSISFLSFDDLPELQRRFSASPEQPHPTAIEHQYHLARERNTHQSRGRVSIKSQNKIRKIAERRGPDVLRWISQSRTE